MMAINMFTLKKFVCSKFLRTVCPSLGIGAHFCVALLILNNFSNVFIVIYLLIDHARRREILSILDAQTLQL